MSDERPYLYPTPEKVHRLLLKWEHASGEPFSLTAATVSLMMDADKGRVRSQREYARIWRWTRDKVRHHLPAMLKEVEQWRTCYGDLTRAPQQPPSNPPLTPHLPPTNYPTTTTTPTDIPPNGGDGATKIKGKTKRDPLLDHPAVVAFKEVIHRTPNHQQRAAIAASVEDELRWRGVLVDWMNHGWNPGNIPGMIDRYAAEPKHNGRGAAPSTPDKPTESHYAEFE